MAKTTYYQLASPMQVGDPMNTTTITKLQVVSIGVSFRETPPLISVVLEDPISHYQINIVYPSPSITNKIADTDVLNTILADNQFTGLLTNGIIVTL